MASDESSRATVRRVPLGRSPRRLSFEKRLRLWLYAMGLPLLACCIALLLDHEATWLSITLTICVVCASWAMAVSFLSEQIVRPLQTLSNVVAALREDDYSFRARGARRNDALGDLALEVNALAGMLQAQRTGALEAMALLERVMASMESPVLAFDAHGRLVMLNAAGERAFSLKSSQALGRSAEDLHLEHLLEGQDGNVVSLRQQLQGSDRSIIKRSGFRLRGVEHRLLLLSDVSKALREEERQAWERLIRVLGHEINNSLTPIKSIAGSLRARLATGEAPPELERGLSVIENRAESLNRFLQAYRQLMRLPTPSRAETSVAALVNRVVHLEARMEVRLAASPDVTVVADVAQIEQALINLVRNAVEASLSPEVADRRRPEVEVAWSLNGENVVISVADNGLGLTNAANLFVPFYTTKPEGAGIGLVLAQQIAEAHGGGIQLRNRPDTEGCVAELSLPIV